MVYGFASGFWRGRRIRCGARAAGDDPREHLVCAARGSRGSGNHSATRRRRGKAVKAVWQHLVIVALGAALLSSCAAPHGQPRRGSEALAPNEVMEFGALYAENCAGCHGENGRGGAAIALANPVYLAIADEAAMRKVIATGAPGTAMPAFGASAGGLLADKQIDVIAQGIQAQWSKAGILDGADPPSYTAKSAGDVARGEAGYKTYCASCHGRDGAGSAKGSAITNDSFLALMSDQE